MRSQAKIMLSAVGIDAAEKLGRGLEFVATDAKPNNVSFLVLNCEVRHALRFGGSELTDRIEYPQQRDTEIALASRPTAFQAFEDAGEVLLAVETDPDRDVDLGVQDVFCLQAFHEAIGNQFVVGGLSQVLGNSLESHEEAGEVGVVVELFRVGECGSSQSVTMLDFQQGWGIDRPFKVEVELGLGQR